MHGLHVLLKLAQTVELVATLPALPGISCLVVPDMRCQGGLVQELLVTVLATVLLPGGVGGGHVPLEGPLATQGEFLVTLQAGKVLWGSITRNNFF